MRIIDWQGWVGPIHGDDDETGWLVSSAPLSEAVQPEDTSGSSTLCDQRSVSPS